jgi:Cu(I)/Ag(I) efflux system membrane protein CusA/SilA
MVIYLDDAVARARGAAGTPFTRQVLRTAVIDGALLRLRPKVMTVSTVVAGLLPIMWSTRVGAEVMKPIAAPVLGGMVSSLLHVLIVTPVLYLWIQERRLRLAEDGHEPISAERKRRSRFILPIGIGAVLVVLASGWYWQHQRQQQPSSGVAIRTVEANGVRVTVLSPDGALHQGRNVFSIEFRNAGTNEMIDVGNVRASAAMTMPGMAMSGGLQTTATNQPGRYTVSGDFGMAGTWQLSIEWNGPAGVGKVAFEGAVQ